ncbi:putative membrane protein [Vibrio cholerae HC-46A1]|nr:putative membrane protein [Vibrio cholerae HC-20A2]EJH56508.1 putative membrane protein [Vibrio cholerae HC-46A1]EMP97143.1 putative membrane protein [Vibrio cholerae O1 str. AG-7404]EYC49006.1 membrane protein [Vibrio cholerae O1 biovar El Tor str. L-3226]KEA48128.1 membrane protein [Vibrio cholerae O1 biovar El Tor]
MGAEKRVSFGFIADLMAASCASFCGAGSIKGAYFMKNRSVCH